MDGFIVLLVILFLAAPVIAIIALVKSSGINNGLRRLEQRIAALENRPTAGPPRTAVKAPPPQLAARAEPAARITTEPLPPLPTPPLPRPVATSVPSSTTSSAAPASSRDIGFEERFGTRWVVWVGGVALALGGIFLVRYTIEQGLIGPRVRIMLGALLHRRWSPPANGSGAANKFSRCPVFLRQTFRPF
jgi:uncharacterized membrane protein